MKKTWKPIAAGILCIIVGVISVIPGMISLPFLFVTHPLGNFTYMVLVGIVIAPAMAIVGGVYALRRRRWGLALAGSIFTLLCCVTLGIFGIIFFLGAVADNSDITQSAVTALAIGIIVIVAIFGILGLLSLILVILGKREFK